MQTVTFPSLSGFQLRRDLVAGLVIFLVALPLCLGIAITAGAPLFSGLISGIIGGIVVGFLSRSHTSVSGPAAGLTAIIIAEMAALGSFQTFLLAVLIAGGVQIVAGLLRGGFIASFFPSSVIRGLLAAIGLILILKNIPHLFGHDADPEGEMAFLQPDHENTFTELFSILGHVHPGAACIGIASILLLAVWDQSKWLKKLPLPGPLVAIVFGACLQQLLKGYGEDWSLGPSHLIQVPVAESWSGFLGLFQMADFSQLFNPQVYRAGMVIALVASLETLLNVEAIDKIDPKQRTTPPNQELFAQGVGNVLCGLLGGIPVTSVVVRSTVNINAGGQSKLATISHGFYLLLCVALLPHYLNMIPISSTAAVLLITGWKLTSWRLWKQMWQEGYSQFLPFAITVVAIVFTDLLTGVVIGLAVSLTFILNSNFRWPLRVTTDKHFMRK